MQSSKKTLQGKLTRLIVITSASILLLTSGFYFTYEYITYKASAASQLETIGQIVASNSVAALSFDDADNAREILQALKAEKDIEVAAIFDSTGFLFARYPDTLKSPNIPLPKSFVGYRYIPGGIEGFEPVSQEGRTYGFLYLRASTTAINGRLFLYALVGLVVVSVCSLLAYLLSRQLQKSITTPIISLAETAKIISGQGDYSVRAGESEGYEAALLTDAFNRMLDQIELQTRKITDFNRDLENRIMERTKELEQANQTLSKQNDFVEKIFDSTVDLIAVFDQNLNYITLNKNAYEAYQVTKEQIINKHILAIFPSTRESGMLADLERALKGEFIHNTSYKSPVLDRYFETFFIPMKDEQGNVYRILTIAHDTTLIMEANDNLRRVNEELAKSNRNLEQFAYITSHDLQEPLRKIQTFSELSERSLPDAEAVRRYLVKINSSASRMSEMVRSVLNYSRLSQPDKDFETVSLNSIVENVSIDLEIIIREKQAIIEYGDLPDVWGIPIQLSQLMLNLVSNAIKFCDKTPLIKIRARGAAAEEIAGLDARSRYICLSVEDNGIGFEQIYADKLFTIFQRLHNPNEYAGTGIGLALCRKIAENHRGKITVTSIPGTGSVFYVFLPVTVQH